MIGCNLSYFDMYYRLNSEDKKEGGSIAEIARGHRGRIVFARLEQG
jgi:hypothetical protein